MERGEGQVLGWAMNPAQCGPKACSALPLHILPAILSIRHISFLSRDQPSCSPQPPFTLPWPVRVPLRLTQNLTWSGHAAEAPLPAIMSRAPPTQFHPPPAKVKVYFHIYSCQGSDLIQVRNLFRDHGHMCCDSKL